MRENPYIYYAPAKAFACRCRPPGRYPSINAHINFQSGTRLAAVLTWEHGHWERCPEVPTITEVQEDGQLLDTVALILEDANSYDEAWWRDWFKDMLSNESRLCHSIVEDYGAKRREHNVEWARWSDCELALLDLDEQTAITGRKLMLGGFAGGPDELVMVASALA